MSQKPKRTLRYIGGAYWEEIDGIMRPCVTMPSAIDCASALMTSHSLPPVPKTPPPPKFTRLDAALMESFVDLLSGKAEDVNFSDCVKPLTIIMDPGGIVEVRKYQNYHAYRAMGSKPDSNGKITPTIFLPYKIPLDIYQKICNFFRWVMKEHYDSEAIVYLYVRDGKVEIEIPPQEVSKASVSAPRPTDASHLLAEVHSHNTMNAFWSGVDDSSEHAEGFLYGVIGHLDKATPACLFRVRALGEWQDVTKDALGGYNVPNADTVPEEWKAKVKRYTSTLWAGNTGARFDRDDKDTHRSSASMGHRYRGHTQKVFDRVPIDKTTFLALPLALRRVIRKDGFVSIIWENGGTTPTLVKGEELTPEMKATTLVEGKDWTDVSHTTNTH